MDQYLVPYLISSHPGCTMKDAVELAEYLRDIHHQPEQVQDFYPTPSTLSTVMYYTGVDPRSLRMIDPAGKTSTDFVEIKSVKFTEKTMEASVSVRHADLQSMKKVYVPQDPHEKAMQRALMQFRNPKLRPLVEEALKLAHREDLIGYGPRCLIRPEGTRRDTRDRKPRESTRRGSQDRKPREGTRRGSQERRSQHRTYADRGRRV